MCNNFGKYLAVFKQLLVVENDVSIEGFNKNKTELKYRTIRTCELGGHNRN